ncbi:nuclear transport factor 2 family protein, partial [bacterium]
MSLQGKGYFIWKLPKCENANPASIGRLARSANLTHVLIKICDGIYKYNVEKSTLYDYIPPVVAELKHQGIQVWGWHYVYGQDPQGEARVAAQRVKDLELDGYVVDAEVEYKASGRAAAAKAFMSKVRAELPNIPIALSSYRYPSYHPQFPWKEFLNQCDLNMPQMYWEKAHNPASQLVRCVKEFQAMTPYRPIYPTGAAYGAGAWRPTATDIVEFLDKVQTLDIPAANFYSWDESRNRFPDLWKAVSEYSWGELPPEPPKDIADQLVDAWNSHDIEQITALYQPNAAHITSARTVHGLLSIRAWYGTFLNELLPNGRFTRTGLTGTGNNRHLSWSATSDNGKVVDGVDSLG